MSTEPEQASDPEPEDATSQQAESPPAESVSDAPAEGSDAGVRRRAIKIGSQREGQKPIRQTSGIQETWSHTKKQEPAGAVPPKPAEQAPSITTPAAPPSTEPPPVPSGAGGPAGAAPPIDATVGGAVDAPPVPAAAAGPATESPAAESANAAHAPAPTPPPAPAAPTAPAQSPVSAELPRLAEPPAAAADALPPGAIDFIAPMSPPPSPSGRIPRISEDLQAEIDAVLEDGSLEGESFEQMLLDDRAVSEEPELEPELCRPGTVVKIHEDNVFFSLATRHEGVASLRQFDEPPEVGAQMEVIVNRFSVDDGLYEVAVPGASMKVEDWSDVTEGMVVEAQVTGHNSGGLECQVGHIRGFIPASQIALYHVENLEEFVDQRLQCVVTEANPQRRNLVVSRRAMLEREREEARQKLWEELEVGQVREGVVRRIQDFGAFVDIGGVDGLIHISQLSWDRVEHPSEVLQEGQTIKVRVEKVDREADRIGLSYRDVLENPWTKAEANYPANALVTGTVSRIMQFGAFVKLEPGIEGLVHISEIAHHRVTRVSHVLEEGQEIEVKVLSVDADAQRISLSLKQANPLPDGKPAPPQDEEQAADETQPRAAPRRSEPLKGGVDKPSGGDQFGLKW